MSASAVAAIGPAPAGRGAHRLWYGSHDCHQMFTHAFGMGNHQNSLKKQTRLLPAVPAKKLDQDQERPRR